MVSHAPNRKATEHSLPTKNPEGGLIKKRNYMEEEDEEREQMIIEQRPAPDRTWDGAESKQKTEGNGKMGRWFDCCQAK